MDKDIGELLREVDPQGNEGSDDEEDLGRYTVLTKVTNERFLPLPLKRDCNILHLLMEFSEFYLSFLNRTYV